MLAPGSRLGSYEIVAALGAGGMGEVYRARDLKLHRDVAIKILPERVGADPEMLARFEREAQAVAALSHPNILSIHDFGVADGVAYAVTELLEGDTLRAKLEHGALPPRKAVEYALQIVHGIAAAHQRGVVHRDLKPENVFVTEDGRVKILDFGLAKSTGPAGAGSTLQTQSGTSPGTVMGTVGYMSPEQVRGQPVDHRTDIFSFGVVFYEMLAGVRAFHGDSHVETMNAILKEDPPEVSGSAVPPALDRIVRRCLEKSPAERFHSAHDLGLALETLSAPGGGSGAATPLPARRRAMPWILTAGALAIAGAAYLAGRGIGRPEPIEAPEYRKLTFRRGDIHSARFAGDGKTVVYSATWPGTTRRVYSTHEGSPESLALAFENADVTSVSSTGELALVQNRRQLRGYARVGTLARASLSGGASRAVLEDVQDADWLPDGSGFVAARFVDGRFDLEFPAGKSVYQTGGYISDVRVSPDGTLVAFADHPAFGDDRGSIAVIDRAGKKRTLTGDYASLQGVAWAPGGREIWYTASETGNARGLFAVSVSGERRVVMRVAGGLQLGDIGPNGDVLVWQLNSRSGILGRAPGDTVDRDLTWLDWSTVPRVSNDGKLLLFTEQGDGGGRDYSVFVRPTDGGAAVRLGSGQGYAISPDGKWVLAVRLEPAPSQYVLLPMGAGEPRALTHDDLQHRTGYFLADGSGLIFEAFPPGHPPRLYRQDLSGGPARPITPEGVTGVPSSDGKLVAFEGKIYAVDGGAPRPIPGIEDGDRVEAWSGDAKTVLVRQLPAGGGQLTYRLDLATGHRTLFHELAATSGVTPGLWFTATPDGSSFFFTFNVSEGELFLVNGLR